MLRIDAVGCMYLGREIDDELAVDARDGEERVRVRSIDSWLVSAAVGVSVCGGAIYAYPPVRNGGEGGS